MGRHIVIGAAQLGPIHLADTRAAVVERLIALLRQAHRANCRMVVFPELALTTFFPRYWYDNDAELDRFFERSMPNKDTQPLFDEAKRLKIGFYLGYAELIEEGGKLHRFNTSILVDENGRIVGKYRKVHLPGHVDRKPEAPFQHLEKRYFEVGNFGFPVFEAFDADVGMAICNDRRWPETFRVMALQNAEIVVLGFNTPTANIWHPEPPHLRMFHHNISLQSAAYQNGIWVVATAKAGAEDGFHLHGGTCIVAPTGEIVTHAIGEGDELVSYDCDLDLGEYIRKSVFDFARHRRVEHYRLIVDRVAPPERGTHSTQAPKRVAGGS